MTWTRDDRRKAVDMYGEPAAGSPTVTASVRSRDEKWTDKAEFVLGVERKDTVNRKNLLTSFFGLWIASTVSIQAITEYALMDLGSNGLLGSGLDIRQLGGVMPWGTRLQNEDK